MVAARALVQGARGVAFGAGDDAPFLGVVVRRQLDRLEAGARALGLGGVVELVRKSERRRLPAAAARSHRAGRVPVDRVRPRDVGVVVAMVDDDAMPDTALLEPLDERARDRIPREVGEGLVDRALRRKWDPE